MSLTRRQWCVGCAKALVLAGCTAATTPSADLGARDLRPGDMTPAPISAGPASGIAVGAAVLVAGDDPYYLCRDLGGLYALSASCTHNGCEVGFVSGPPRFSCPCHGSRFDFNGAVTQGPAQTPLPHYEVTIDTSGDAIINPARTVAPTTRA